MYLAQNLKYLREQRGLSQQGLSNELGLTQPAIWNWENQHQIPDIFSIIKIAEYFGVTLDELILKRLAPSAPVYVSNLIYLRKKHHVTQSDIADFLGFKGKSSICAIETGSVDISVENLIKLADYFGVTLDQMAKHDLAREWRDARWQQRETLFSRE